MEKFFDTVELSAEEMAQRPEAGRAGRQHLPGAVRLRRHRSGRGDADADHSWIWCPSPRRCPPRRPAMTTARRRRGGLRSQRPHRRHRVQDHLRPVRQVLHGEGVSGKITSDMPCTTPPPATPRSWAACISCRARRARRSRRSAAATSAPSARWIRSRPATPCATPST